MGLRQDRLADQVRDVIASFFSAGQLNDPRLDGVTITAVKLSADLQIAKVYFRLYNGQDESDARKGLARASSMFRRRLASTLDCRRIPSLQYFFDESVENASRIEDLLRNLN